MPVRFRQNRILYIFFLLILILIYFNYYYHLKNSIINKNEIKKTSTVVSIVREQFIGIGGKKLRKIDWHDYQAINRENARKGI